MRRHYEGIIVDALGRLQHGCCGHLYRTRVIGRWMSLLDPGHLVGSLSRRRPWPAYPCSPSSLRGEHYSSSDGSGSSEIC